MEKSDEVIERLRHLPYVRNEGSDEAPEVAPWARMEDWERVCNGLAAETHNTNAAEYRFLSEGEYQDDVPSWVIGITDTGPDVECFLLDTKEGTIYWPVCDLSIRSDLAIPMAMDNPDEDGESENEDEADEDASEKEHSDAEDAESGEEPEWRNGGRWAIADFFKILKNQYRELKFIPISTHKVLAENGRPRTDEEGLRPMLKDIYQKHDWPDLDRFRKEECLAAVQKALEEHYPDHAA